MAAIDLATNHLAMESPLLARVKSVQGLAQAGGAYEFDSLLREGGDLPAAFVLYAGDEAGDVPGEFVQAWQVVLVAKPRLGDGDTSLDALGKLVSKLIEALFGSAWQPADNAQPPVRVFDSTEPVIYADGQVHVIFSLRVVLTKALTQNNRWS